MAKLVFLAMTSAREGRDADFNERYDAHLQDLLDAPGCVAAQRFALDEVQLAPDQPYRYLTLYEIETDDAAATMAGIGARAGASGIAETLAGAPIVALYRPMGPRIVEQGDRTGA